ncbi:GPI-anchored CFEM domain protein, partial [Pseudocercospora fuligena]
LVKRATNPGGGGNMPSGVSTAPNPGQTATLISTAYLPGVTDLPTCSQTCIDGYDGCAEDDATCICSNQNLLQQWSCCVSQRCNAQGQADVISFAQNLCGDYGVTALPTMATCNTNPGNGPGTGPGTGIGATATATQYLPGVTDLPTCSQICIDGYDGCDENDATCICSNQNLLEQWSCCVSQRCSAQGQADVISFAENLCGEYGVTALPTVATCNTNPGSGPGPTVTQSGPGATVTQYLPGVTDLPTCSQLCIDGYDGCDENDATCICSNQNLLEQWSCCVSQRCNAQGQADVISFAENLCGEYGVTALPTVATCNTNPGSGPGPTSYVPSGVSTVVSNGVTVVSTYGTGKSVKSMVIRQWN